MTPSLGGLITQMCTELQCPEVVPFGRFLKKCKRYASPTKHIRKNNFMCPSQPTVAVVKKDKVRVGQKKTKRQHS